MTNPEPFLEIIPNVLYSEHWLNEHLGKGFSEALKRAGVSLFAGYISGQTLLDCCATQSGVGENNTQQYEGKMHRDQRRIENSVDQNNGKTILQPLSAQDEAPALSSQIARIRSLRQEEVTRRQSGGCDKES